MQQCSYLNAMFPKQELYGDIVMVERLDKTIVAGSPVNLPCFGYFELFDGKITLWRDYFDLTTYTTALTAALAK